MEGAGDNDPISPARPVLSYQSPIDPISGPRPKWVYALTIFYLLLLVGMILTPISRCFFDSNSDRGIWGYISFVVVLFFLAGFFLILVPIKQVRQRPIKRRSVWVPILTTATMMTVLALALLGVLLELFENHLDPMNHLIDRLHISGAILTVIAMAMVWIFWLGIFALIVIYRGHEEIGNKIHRWLIAGSVLELCIAVPAHIIVRRRNECCGTILTGIGICTGVCVAIIAFGPSVFFLYHLRRKKISG